MRSVVLPVVWVASGCSVVFPLEGPPPSACGRFVDPEPVAFDPALGAVTELSVDASGARGFALATDPVTPTNRLPVLAPLALGEDRQWHFDPARQGNLETLRTNQNVKFGRIAPNGELFAALHGAEDDFRVFRYTFDGTTWGAVENVSPLVATESSFAGGEIETPDGFRVLPILHVTEDNQRYVSIVSSEPVGRPWLTETIDGRVTTDAINQHHEVTQAALALGPDGALVLAYAAQPPGSPTGSRLYVSRQRGDGTFPVGVPIAELDEDGDEVEPWLAPDCSALSFRRGETIFTARAEPDDDR